MPSFVEEVKLTTHIHSERIQMSQSLLQLGSLSVMLESVLIFWNPVYVAVLIEENPDNGYYLPFIFNDTTELQHSSIADAFPF